MASPAKVTAQGIIKRTDIKTSEKVVHLDTKRIMASFPIKIDKQLNQNHKLNEIYYNKFFLYLKNFLARKIKGFL
jgi:hypothetical protein